MNEGNIQILTDLFMTEFRKIFSKEMIRIGEKQMRL